jgi:uncharacterized YkwD family protein
MERRGLFMKNKILITSLLILLIIGSVIPASAASIKVASLVSTNKDCTTTVNSSNINEVLAKLKGNANYESIKNILQEMLNKYNTKTEQPAAPAAKQPAQPAAEQPEAKQPVQPTTEQPEAKQPAQPAAEQPEAKQPAQPTTEQPANTDTNTDSSVRAYEKEVINLVNVERQKAGLAPLKENTQLSDVARTKSEDMKNKGYFSHTSPTYGSPFDMMKSFGIKYSAAGENIAKGQRTPSEVVNAWMNSEGHRANILNSNYTEIGVGYTVDSNGTAYWTQMFIRP